MRTFDTLWIVATVAVFAGFTTAAADAVTRDADGAVISAGGTAFFEPTFDDIQNNVFTPSCAFSFCHGGSAPSIDLNLEAGVAYDEIVDVESLEVPGTDLVEPFDPDASYLICKLEGEDGVDNEGIAAEKLYTTPEDMEYVYEQLKGVGRYMFAATFGNVHGSYKPGAVKLRPQILKQGQEAVIAKYGKEAEFDFVFHGGSGTPGGQIRATL